MSSRPESHPITPASGAHEPRGLSAAEAALRLAARGWSAAQGRSVVFCTLTLSVMLLILANRNQRHSALRSMRNTNPLPWRMALAMGGLLAAVLYLPWLVLPPWPACWRWACCGSKGCGWPPGQAGEGHGQRTVAGACSERPVTPVTAKDAMIREA